MCEAVQLTTRSLSDPAPISKPTSSPTPVNDPAVPRFNAAYLLGSRNLVKGSSSSAKSALKSPSSRDQYWIWVHLHGSSGQIA